MNFNNILTEHKRYFKLQIERFFNSLTPINKGEDELIKAMQYACISENAKYIRSFLVLECFKILNIEITQQALNIALAVEFVHAYSLIHDDLPCMDNSDTRRGAPSLHKQFKESTALMAGNSLLTLAFEILDDMKTVKLLAKASGVFGIMSGQVLDLNEDFKKESFETMNYHKTGKLFEFCCVAGFTFLESEKQNIQALAEYGRTLGTIFQMTDDILDEGEGGVSYLSIFSKEELRKEIEKNIYKAQNLISNFKNNTILTTLPVALSIRSS